MRLFWKVFSAVFISFVITVFSISYVTTSKQISEREQGILGEKQIIGDIITNEVKIGYLESNWPFDSLNVLSEQENFLFWWIIKDDGVIHLANNASFMGTYAYNYFPQLKNSTMDGNIFLNHEQNYGILYKSFGTEKNKWSFWLGFSLKEITKAKRDIILIALVSSSAALLMLGIVVYLLIQHFINPLDKLTKATKQIKTGNLNYQVKIKTKDELEELANSFDDMRLGLKDRNDLLNSLLTTFKGKFGNLATILVRKNVQELVNKNPRIAKILPKSLGISLAKAKKLQRE